MAPDLIPVPVSPSPAATRTRVKWENVAILLGGLVVASFAVVVVLMQGAEQSSGAASTATSRTATEPVSDQPVSEPASELTMTDALGLVEEARQLMAEARWEEAAERLASVPTELRDVAGATRLAAQLETSRARHERLRAEAVAAVEARQWKQASTLLTQLAAIAPLDAELQALQATVDQALAPPPAATPRDQGAEGVRTSTPVEPAGARTAAGGGSSPTRPAAHAPRPAGGSGRPAEGSGRPAATVPAPSATGGRPAASGGGASTPAAIDPLAPIELTPQQEAELAAALGLAAGELK